MAGNIAVWATIIVITGLFLWLSIRAWRSRRILVRWFGGILASILTLVFLLVSVVSGIGLTKMYSSRADPAQSIAVEGSAAQIARGEHIASVVCIDCHSLNGQLPLSGGKDLGAGSPAPIGSLVSFNLTPGGPLKDWTDGEIFRTLRQGVDKEGRPLIVMSSVAVRSASDEDLKAVIAFLRSQQAVSTVKAGGDNVNLVLALFVGAGLVPVPPQIEGSIQAPPKAATAEYGKYISSFLGCTDCHGPDLQGGIKGGLSPNGPNLMLVKGWNLDQFVKTIRTGVDPSGHELSDQMPWKTFSSLDDEELGALYQYLHSLGGIAGK